MKRLVCSVLFAVMIILAATTAFAAEATYHNGLITVSTGDSGFFEILIDGVGTGRWVGTGMPSNTFSWELTDGSHTVRLYSPDGDAGSSVTILVGDASSAASPSDTEKSNVPGGEGKAVPVSPAEPTCTENGMTEDGQIIPALGHRYAVVGHNDTVNSYECMRCGNKLQAGLKDAVQNRYGNIMLDESGNAVNYRAAPGKADDKTMTFTLDKAAEKIELTLDNSLIMQIIREGFKTVEIVNDKAATVIDLYQITPSWFNTTEKVENYIFTIDGEARVTVETLINGEKLAAETFTGVTVK